MNRYFILLALFLGSVLLNSCSKSEKDFIDNKEAISETKSTKKDINITDVIYRTHTGVPENLRRNNPLRSIGSNTFPDYDYQQVYEATLGDNSAYVIPKKNSTTEFQVVAYKKDFGVSSILSMDIRENGGKKVVTLMDEKGTLLFSFEVKKDGEYKVISANENYDTMRASTGAWICGMGLGIVGGMWGTVVGMVNPLAGMAVGLAYTALSIWACDGA